MMMMMMTRKRSECGVIATWLRRRSGGEEWEKVGGGGEGRLGEASTVGNSSSRAQTERKRKQPNLPMRVSN